MVNRRRFITGAVATASIVVAGCTDTEESIDNTDTENTEEAQSGSETGDNGEGDGSEELPPGVTEESVNGEVVATTHMEELRTRSAMYDFEFAIDWWDAPQEDSGRVDGESVLIEEKGTGEKRMIQWSDGEQRYTKATDGDQTNYFVPHNPVTPGHINQQRYVDIMLENLEYEFVEMQSHEETGDSVAKIKASDLIEDGDIQWRGIRDVQEVESVAIVDQTGIVRALEVTATYGDDEETMEASYVVSAVDETTVGEPDWVAEAGETALEMAISDEESALAVTLKRGTRIREGATLNVVTGQHSEVLTVDGVVEKGDTLYLSEQGNEIGVQVNSEPASGNSLESPVDLQIIGQMNGLRYQVQYMDDR